MKYSSLGPALLAAGLLFCTLFVPFGAYADSKKDELSAKQNQAQQARRAVAQKARAQAAGHHRGRRDQSGHGHQSNPSCGHERRPVEQHQRQRRQHAPQGDAGRALGK